MSSQNICEVCNGTNIEEVDGFFYCRNCGSQQSERVYEDDDGNIGTFTRGLRMKANLKEGAERRPFENVSRKDKVVTKERYMTLRAQTQVEFPKYLQQCGYRIGTFTKLLHRFGDILVRDFDVDECIIPKIRYILQKYLQMAGIAFSEAEIAACDEDRFSLIQKKTVPEVHNERMIHKRATQKKKREKLKQKAKKAKQVTANEALSQFDDNFDDSLKEQEAAEQAEQQDNLEDAMFEVNIFRLISTKLSRKAVIASGNVFLDLDLLLVILYLACISSGVNWILLSDITRWYREGRFPITKEQVKAISFAVGMEKLNEESMRNAPMSRDWSLNYAVQPLYESYRVLHAMIQMLNLPQEIVIRPDFTQILLRLVYNLNLPLSIMNQLRALEKLIPCESECSLKRSKVAYPFNTDDLAAFLQESKDGKMVRYGSVSFFRYLNRSHYLRAPCSNGEGHLRKQTVMVADETKAAALILFTLKLMFGLDDVREYSLHDAALDGENTFDFGCYLLQLRLRMNVVQGTPVARVLSKDFAPEAGHSASMFDEEVGLKDLRFYGANLYGRTREAEFSRCVPPFAVQVARNKVFFELFQDDFVDQTGKGFMGNDAVYAPLRYTATKNQAWLAEVSRRADVNDLLDANNVNIFFKSHSQEKLDYRNTYGEYEPSTPFKERLDNDSRCGSEAKRSKWRSFFPSASTYQVYPRSSHIRSFLELDDEFDEGQMHPTLFLGDTEAMYNIAKPCFSKNFAFFLRQLSTIVGEQEQVLYFVLVMVEMMIFDRSRLAAMESSLLNGEPLKLTTEMIQHSGWEVYLIEEESGAPRWTRKYAAHNVEKKFGLFGGISLWSKIDIPTELGMSFLIWKHW
ncbi:hypothetical protein QR680_011250 [Steinernema hermaphroditum]|uniref:Rrn7/TAF1B C-terminal cyclin domain-containing protein n=1 Tax=Steinernema hermaphroditum TaxID=289476 RepID=A0AA39IRP6_9BILA|nr:hypothetical protein QR680_011250 [Steinernema hermaphroditum]